MKLTTVIKAIKTNELKFDKLKSQLDILDGILKGAYVVKPLSEQDEETLKNEINRISEYSISPSKPLERVKHYETINTDSIKELLAEIKEIL